MLGVAPSAWWGGLLPALAALNRVTVRFPGGKGDPTGAVSFARAIHDPHVDRPEHPRRRSHERAPPTPTRSLVWGPHRGGRSGVGVRGRLRGHAAGTRSATPSAGETPCTRSGGDDRGGTEVAHRTAVRRADARRTRPASGGSDHVSRLRPRCPHFAADHAGRSGGHRQRRFPPVGAHRHPAAAQPQDHPGLWGSLTSTVPADGRQRRRQDEWDANWCTFATWSSRTIGTCIDRQPEHGLIHHLLRRLPAPLRRLFYGSR